MDRYEQLKRIVLEQHPEFDYTIAEIEQEAAQPSLTAKLCHIAAECRRDTKDDDEATRAAGIALAEVFEEATKLVDHRMPADLTRAVFRAAEALYEMNQAFL